LRRIWSFSTEPEGGFASQCGLRVGARRTHRSETIAKGHKMQASLQRTVRPMRLVVGMLLWLAVQCFFFDVALAARGGTLTGTIAGSKDPVVVFLDGARAANPSSRKHQIVQRNIQFSTKLLVIGTGDSVAFPNNDRVSHNVFSLSRIKKFDFGIYPPGSNRSVEFMEPGLVDVFCSIHQEMHTTIAVVPSDYYAASDKGAFRIVDIPAGKYTAVVWHKGKEVSRQTIVVGNAADVNMNIDLK
jgi:plastocyanin